MNWKEEPASENQLGHLRQLGYDPDHPLTKGEAANLISDFEALGMGQAFLQETDTSDLATLSAYRLHLTVGNAKRAATEAQALQLQDVRYTLELAIAQRQAFWADTCNEGDRVHLVSPQAVSLHKRHGYRFAIPTLQQVQVVLDALDSILPSWDRDHPELFYQTLELNFPDLLRHQNRLQ